MDTHILINNHAEKHFDFELVVEGLNAEDVNLRFVIHSSPFDMVFDCKHVGDSKWEVNLPKMPYLEPTTYSFTIEAVIDGYHFIAHSGTLTVVKTPEVYVRKEDVEMKVESKPTSIPTKKKKTSETKITLAPTIKPAKKPVVTETKREASKPSEVVDQAKLDEIIDRIKLPLPATEPKRDSLVKLIVEDTTTDEDKANRKAKEKDAKVKQLIRESKEEKDAKKARQVARRKRLNEEAKEKQRTEQEAKKKAQVLTEQQDKQEPSEKDVAVRTVLESVEKEKKKTTSKRQVFKRAGSVVR